MAVEPVMGNCECVILHTSKSEYYDLTVSMYRRAEEYCDPHDQMALPVSEEKPPLMSHLFTYV